MSYEEFQHLARLFTVGALDDEEREHFSAGRLIFGERAEAFIDECRKLNTIFALSLQPREPLPETKQRLLARIRASEQSQDRNGTAQRRVLALAAGSFSAGSPVFGPN